MTTSTPNPRRRTPWIIGGIVLVGVGLVVGGNWKTLLVEYHSYQLVKGLTLPGQKGDPEKGVFTVLDLGIGEAEAALVSLEEASIPKLKELATHEDHRVRNYAKFLIREIKKAPADRWAHRPKQTLFEED